MQLYYIETTATLRSSDWGNYCVFIVFIDR